MMTCPATVPVKVELCPEASNVIANSTAAKPVPTIGASSLYASSIS